jgi:hypothetical protein
MTTKQLDHDPFEHLPLFASDLELATAIVGSKNASGWVRDKLPVIAAKPGFPAIDDFHGGRPVPLIKRFYEHYLGITGGSFGIPGGKEADWSTLKRKRKDPK